VLNGGAGNDIAVYGAAVGSYTLVSYNGSVAVLTHGADGSDRLQGIEVLQFTDTAIAAGAVAAFDGLAYIASYPDLIQVFGPNPQGGFDHYVSSGFAEGRATSFDPLQYLASNVELLRKPAHPDRRTLPRASLHRARRTAASSRPIARVACIRTKCA
jgi:hypothetical protein